jgi:3-hydroxyacyl-[acyl-carrier-protein] dehydratase
VTATIDVPQGGPLFEGHFPGRPVLPGVTLVSLAVEAVGGGPLRVIPHFRLRRPVGPGDHLSLESSEDAGGVTRVEIRRGSAVVANGTLDFGAPEPARNTATAVASRPVKAPPPLDDLLPHRAPMRFVSRILGEAEDGLTCEVVLPAACGLVRNGTAPALIAIEGAAQAAAIWEALRRARSGEEEGPRIGYLVGLSGVVFYAGRVPAEAPMIATVVLEDYTPPLAHYRIEVSIDAAPLLRGTIGAWA